MASQSFVGSNASANSTTITMPAGIAAGDRAFFFDSAVAGGGTAPTAVAPSGFTLLATHTATNGTFSVRHSVYYKDLSGSETTLTGMAVGVTCNKAVFVTRKSAGAVWETPGDVSVVASATSISNQTVNVPSGAVLVLAYGDDFGTVGTGAGRLTMNPAGTYADAGTIRIGYINYGSGPADNTASSSVTAGGVLSSLYQRVLDSTVALTASNLATGSASLGTPAVGQVHALGAAGLATASPALGTPTAALVHTLAASNLTTSAPVLGTPAATHIHVLAASALATGAASLGAPPLGQQHAMATGGLTTGAADLGTPAVGQVHATTAAGLATGSPALGTPAVGQNHTLGADGLSIGSPTIGAPAIGTVNALTATGIATGSPSLGTPAMTNIPVTWALTAVGLTTGAPQLGTPTVRQVNSLTANGLTLGAPELGHPGMTLYALGIPSGITVAGPIVGTPSLVRYRGSAPALGANFKRRFVGDFRVGNVFASEIVTDESGRSVRQVTILAADAARPAITLRLIGSTPGRLRFNPQR